MSNKAKKYQITEHILFKKPKIHHNFVFCGTCAIVQRSDNIPRHFQKCHPYLEANTLEKGRVPLFPFTNRWKKYVEECVASKRSITKNQWLTLSFNNKNNYITKKIKEGQKQSRVWYNGEHVVMLKKTWCTFQEKKWEKIKKIRSLNRTINNNLCDSNKETFNLR